MANINPITFELVAKHRKQFLDRPEIIGILDHAKYEGLTEGYAVYAFMEEYRDESVMSIARQRLAVTQEAVIEMHAFIMEQLGISAHASWRRLRQADVNLHQLFSSYLQEQRERLSGNYFLHYQAAVGLFESCCDGYGYLSIEKEREGALEKAQKDSGAEITFCEFFGAEVLSFTLFAEFVGYFLPRKVCAGDDTLRKYAQSIVHLYKWCCERGYIYDHEATKTLRALRLSFKDAMDPQGEYAEAWSHEDARDDEHGSRNE